jgi:hypothetical protein
VTDPRRGRTSRSARESGLGGLACPIQSPVLGDQIIDLICVAFVVEERGLDLGR